MKKVRIAAGAGYAGDRIEPALDILRRGNVDYMIFECLAERTIALAQREKLEDPAKGYNPLLKYRMEKIIPLLHNNRVKIISNMGAANPVAAAAEIREMCRANGLKNHRIAAVVGDDVLEALPQFYNEPIMETGEPLASLDGKIVSANAYIGGEGITRALAQGADIVITGRVADPALVLGPLVYEFQKSYEEYDFLGKAIAAGHLLECGGQITGGYYADPGLKDVPRLWDLGFPILTFGDNGAMVLEKLPGTGGLLNEHTVKEQLLYEIQDPANYLTPDVVADFSQVTVQDLGNDEVMVTGATGKPDTGLLKVSVGYLDGWIGEGEISYGGHNARARAELAGEIIRRRLVQLGYQYRELRIDMLGMDSLYRDSIIPESEPVEVRLRVSVRSDTAEEAEIIGREIEALYTNGPAGGGGARGYQHKVVSVASLLIPKGQISTKICWEGEGEA